MIKLLPVALAVTGVVVLSGAAVLASDHYQTQKISTQSKEVQLQKEVDTLNEAIDSEKALKAQAQTVANQARVECERTQVAYNYLTTYQKRAIGQAPTCPAANAIPQ